MLHRKLFAFPVLLLIMVLVLVMVMVAYQLWRENRYAAIIKVASFENGLDPLLVKAVIKRESRFNPNALGKKGEIGLMQVTPTVGREHASIKRLEKFSPQELYDPTLNVQIGCWYLAKAMRCYEDFNDPVPFALAYYNAGATNSERWLQSTSNRGDTGEFLAAITYPGTRNYIRYIVRWWKLYRIFSF